MRVYCKALFDEPSTGKGFFAHRLAEPLAGLGVCFVGANDKHDINLAISPNNGPTKHSKYILRLDGVYWDKHLDPRNKHIAANYAKADGVVYQSEFCKKGAEVQLGKFGVKCTGAIAVINNGADSEFYTNIPAAKKEFKYQVIASARWRRNKRLMEIATTIIKLGDEYGLWVAGKPDYKIKHPRIKYLGRLDQKPLASYYKGADIMLHLAPYDPCPNSVIECIAAGTPVVCTNSGGTPELVGDDNGIISKADTPFDFTLVDQTKARPIKYERVIKDVKKLIARGAKPKFGAVAIGRVAEQYYQFFMKVLA